MGWSLHPTEYGFDLKRNETLIARVEPGGGRLMMQGLLALEPLKEQADGYRQLCDALDEWLEDEDEDRDARLVDKYLAIQGSIER